MKDNYPMSNTNGSLGMEVNEYYCIYHIQNSQNKSS